jgi:hypothetical protein
MPCDRMSVGACMLQHSLEIFYGLLNPSIAALCFWRVLYVFAGICFPTGAKKNTESHVRKGTQGDLIASHSGPVLNQVLYVPFWVRPGPTSATRLVSDLSVLD